MRRPPQIDCDLHDHLELACLRGYDVCVTLKDRSVISGRATTTRTGSDKVEYFVLMIAGQSVEIPAHTLARLTVTTPGAAFFELDFDAN